MKTKLVALLLLLVQITFSQNTPGNATALWSTTPLSGTARTVGAGGAFGSVGADMGSIDINPAGLGLYRSTDFSITPVVQLNNNESVYDNNHTLSHKPDFGVAQGGFVFTKIFKNSTNPGDMSFNAQPVKSFTFALNFQQQNSFDRDQQYSATNSKSLIDEYASMTNAGIISIYSAPEVYIANYANLLVQNPNGSFSSNLKGPVNQQGDILESGSINRIDAAFGLNVLNKFYIGVDLAVPILGYGISNSITETPVNAQANQIQDYTTNTVLNESGVGFNGIIGLIYRPLPWMRVGAAYHLPTWYAMHEDYQFGLNEDTSVYGYQYGPQALPTFNYGLRTPMKGDFGASFYYKEFGFISVDYDVQNLGASRIHVPQDTTSFQPYYNPVIKSTYGFQHTLHAGIEGAIKVVRLRAGYNFSSSPYKSGQQVTAGYNGVRNGITGGIGVRLKHFYADFAYVYGWSKDATYQLTNPFAINSMSNSSTFLLTVGWKFEAGPKPKKDTQSTEPKRYTPPPVDGDQRY